MNLLVFILVSYSFCAGTAVHIDEDAKRETPDVIRSRGFKSETHKVTTEDGYILTIHRIVNPNAPKSGPVVFMQHGLSCTSKLWLINSPGGNAFSKPANICTTNLNTTAFGNNLGFVLANLGFDVWLANSRGTHYSQAHVRYSPSGRRFWKFTFDQLAEYDLPASLDYVLNQTKKSNLTYVGHAQGTITCYCLLSSKPEYAHKLNLVILLASIPSLKGARPSYGLLNLLPYSSSYLFKLIGGPLFPRNMILTKSLVRICHGLGNAVCEALLLGFGGFNLPQNNRTRLHVYATTFFVQDGLQNFGHLAQILVRQYDTLVKFDYGIKKENRKQYGQDEPPPYNYSNIISDKLVIVRGPNDLIATKEANEILKRQLQVKLLAEIVVDDPKSAHFDHVWAKNAYPKIYQPVLEIVRKTLC